MLEGNRLWFHIPGGLSLIPDAISRLHEPGQKDRLQHVYILRLAPRLSATIPHRGTHVAIIMCAQVRQHRYILKEKDTPSPCCCFCVASCPRMSVDVLGTSWDQRVSMVQYSFTSTETIRLIRTESPGRPPRLSHSSWTLTLPSPVSKHGA